MGNIVDFQIPRSAVKDTGLILVGVAALGTRTLSRLCAPALAISTLLAGHVRGLVEALPEVVLW